MTKWPKRVLEMFLAGMVKEYQISILYFILIILSRTMQGQRRKFVLETGEMGEVLNEHFALVFNKDNNGGL